MDTNIFVHEVMSHCVRQEFNTGCVRKCVKNTNDSTAKKAAFVLLVVIKGVLLAVVNRVISAVFLIFQVAIYTPYAIVCFVGRAIKSIRHPSQFVTLWKINLLNLATLLGGIIQSALGVAAPELCYHNIPLNEYLVYIPYIAREKLIRQEQLQKKLTVDKNESPIESPIVIVNHPPSAIEAVRKEAQQKLDMLWQKYHKERHKQKLQIDTGLTTLYLEFQHSDGQSVIKSDAELANLLLKFEHDSEVFFIPDMYYLDPINSSLSNSSYTDQNFVFLKNNLTNAFAAGKKIVVARLSNNVHAVTAAFKADGTFQIIDSMSHNTISILKLTNVLNEAQIKNFNGEVIHFQGKYITTHLQKGGVECQRFATLYAYQIAKTKDFDAYQDIHGAFANGSLQQFEDYDKCNSDNRMQDASTVKSTSYRAFMDSWAYRSVGLPKKWEELTLQDFQNLLSKISCKSQVSAFCIKQNTFIEVSIDSFPNDNNSEKMELCIKSGADVQQAIPINNDFDFESTVLDSLIPKDAKTKFIILHNSKTNQIQFYRINSNEKLLRKVNTSDGKIVHHLLA